MHLPGSNIYVHHLFITNSRSRLVSSLFPPKYTACSSFPFPVPEAKGMPSFSWKVNCYTTSHRVFYRFLPQSTLSLFSLIHSVWTIEEIVFHVVCCRLSFPFSLFSLPSTELNLVTRTLCKLYTVECVYLQRLVKMCSLTFCVSSRKWCHEGEKRRERHCCCRLYSHTVSLFCDTWRVESHAQVHRKKKERTVERPEERTREGFGEGNGENYSATASSSERGMRKECGAKNSNLFAASSSNGCLCISVCVPCTSFHKHRPRSFFSPQTFSSEQQHTQRTQQQHQQQSISSKI